MQKLLKTLRTLRLKRAERRLEQQIRAAHADSIAHIGRMSLQQGEIIPALSLALADVRTQLRGGMPRSQHQARPALYQRGQA